MMESFLSVVFLGCLPNRFDIKAKWTGMTTELQSLLQFHKMTNEVDQIIVVVTSPVTNCNEQVRRQQSGLRHRLTKGVRFHVAVVLSKGKRHSIFAGKTLRI